MHAINLTHLFQCFSAVADENRDWLTELDGKVGDSDIGLTVTRGFAAAARTLEQSDETDVGRLLFSAGRTISSEAPSTIGTLLAAGFMNAGKTLKGTDRLDLEALSRMMSAVFLGIQKLGKANLGEKTILDGLAPLCESLSASADERLPLPEAATRAAEAANEGFERTKTMVARHGKAATHGEATRALADPGAAVAMLMGKALERCCQ